jgi:DNA mismatch repair protein MutS
MYVLKRWFILIRFRKINIIAQLDVAAGLSELAVSESYTKPILNDGYAIDLKEARHPIIENALPLGEKYIPNDIFLDKDSQQIIMVTGPNGPVNRQSCVRRQLYVFGSDRKFCACKHAKSGCWIRSLQG